VELQSKLDFNKIKDLQESQFCKLIKDNYRDYLNSLTNEFSTMSGYQLVLSHRKRVDHYLKTIYKYILRKNSNDYQPNTNNIPLSFFALGSYGRSEISIFSDIDLMVVYESVLLYNLNPIIESFLTLSWDCGFKIAHRVHHLDDLEDAAKDDITIKSAMLESRYIFGSNILARKTKLKIQNIKELNKKEFISVKIAEYYRRHDNLPIQMRCDLKEGQGGLRDINTLFWIGKTLLDIENIKDLKQYFDEDDFKKLIRSIDYLLKFRVALHIVSKKKNDRLRLELIPEIATLIGYSQIRADKKLLKSLNNISIYTHLCITKLTKDILPLDLKNATFISKDLFIINKKLYAHDTIPTLDTMQILDLILDHNEKIDYYNITFVQYIKKSTFNNFDSSQNTILIKLFKSEKLYHLLMALYYAKKIMKIIPPLLKVRDLPQFDGYHRFPVDLHSIRTMKALENISDPYINSLYEQLNDDEKAVLKAATLLHDCGKGRVQDHSILGANIVKHYLFNLGFQKSYVEYAKTLVRNHILMSNTASREDIYNEKVIYKFISKIGDKKVLQMLYILTYADIESVGEGTYSNFNSSLIRQLYEISLEAFKHKQMIDEASKRERYEKRLKKEPHFQQLSKATQKKLLQIESNLLFFKYTPIQISLLGQMIESMREKYSYLITTDMYLSIEILSKVDLNVGYLLGKLIDYNITTMDIFKIEQGLKYFKIEFEKNIKYDEKLFIKESIVNSFDMSKSVKLPVLDIDKDEIAIDCNHSNSYARMSLNCKDQRGIVANIISIFDDMSIDIASAKIQTMKNRARNLFLIEKNGKFCNTKDIVVEKLTNKEN